jgi:two-component system response regulator AtoC
LDHPLICQQAGNYRKQRTNRLPETSAAVWTLHCYMVNATPGIFMADHANLAGQKRQMKHSAPLSEQLQLGFGHVAESDCPVLIAGEHGVGKRTVARQMHALSRRTRSLYTELESAEASEEALSGLLPVRGTLYLAEIADLSLNLQEWLLHACQRLDWPQSCRLVCGTSRELLDEVRDGRMREDFCYFISSVTLRIPPLRYRRTEILSVADEYLAHYSKQFGRPKAILDGEISDFLLEHPWPDNLAELETAMKTVAAIDDSSISLAALKAAAAATKLNLNRRTRPLKQAARVASSQIERRMISEVMAATGGNRKRAADELGISYKALLYKIKQAGIDSPPASSRTGVER